MKTLTSIALLATLPSAPVAAELPKPEVDIRRMVKFWVKPSINPCRQRKGKSGEIARRGPR